MALNLWTLWGKPLGYHPLSGTQSVNVAVNYNNPASQLVISFMASSPSGATLTVNTTPIAKDFVLTGTPTLCKYDMSGYQLGHIDFIDKNSKGDIVIDNIQLVQKPLPKLTINGLSGNPSDWEQGGYSADGTRATNTARLRLISSDPNKVYMFPVQSNVISLGVASGYAINMGFWQADKTTFISNTGFGSGGSFSVPVAAAYYTITLAKADTTSNIAPSEIPSIQPMLNLGSTPAPYQSKRGDRMVLPKAKKNLFVNQDFINSKAYIDSHVSASLNSDGSFLLSNSDVNSREYIKQYVYASGKPIIWTVWAKAGTSNLLDIGLYNSATGVYDKRQTFTLTNSFAPYSITMPSTRVGDMYSPYIWIPASHNISVLQMQIEENLLATDYTPYSVQENRRPNRLSSKNLLPQSDIDSWDKIPGNSGVSLTPYTVPGFKGGVHFGDNSATRYGYVVMPSKPLANTNYVVSAIVKMDDGSAPTANDFGLVVGSDATTVTQVTSLGNGTYQVSGVYISAAPSGSYAGIIKNTNHSPKGLTATGYQVELGTTVTTYSPYKAILPPSKTGLSFDGVKDYLQLPSMTMDSVEIECLVTAETGGYAFDARSGVSNGYLATNGAKGSGIQSFTVNGVAGTTGSIPYGQRVKIKGFFAGAVASPVNVFATYIGSYKTQGTLYKVTCYLKGNIVAQYDFEKMKRGIAGTTILPSTWSVPKNNAIPTDMSAWQQGGLLGSTGGMQDDTTQIRTQIPFLQPSTAYTISVADGYQVVAVYEFNGSGAFITRNLQEKQSYTFTTSATTTNGWVSIQKTDPANIDSTLPIVPLDSINAKTMMVPGTSVQPYGLYQLVQNPMQGNLIPHFTDPSWAINANVKVLGKDFVHEDASGSGTFMTMYIPVLPNTKYRFISKVAGQQNSRWCIRETNGSGASYSLYGYGDYTFDFTTWSTTTVLCIYIYADSAGSWDVFLPKLIQLNGFEGTINGSPKALNGSRLAKRRLFSKR